MSKRYLNVDGRFFYVGVTSRVGEQLRNAIKSKCLIEEREHEISNNVNTCAMQNEALLKAWEQDIRHCTWAHRMSEHSGDAEAATNAINKELLADKEKKENDPSMFPAHKRWELARKLMEERGYNSTNKPSKDAFRQILSEAGLEEKAGSKKVRTHSVSTRSDERHARTPKVGGLIVLALVVVSIVIAFMCRSAFGKDVASRFKAYQKKVERCLLTNRALRTIVTQRILEEWALIIRFFSPGDEPRNLCLPAVLFLWEKIFEPQMSHGEVLELNTRIKSACGLDMVFSRRNFESSASDVIRENGYDAAWRIWKQLEDYAYSISERIAGNAELKTPSGFGASVYKLLRNWDGKFEQIMMLPIDWKLFFKEHPEFAEHELLVRYGVLSAEEKGECAERVSEAPHRTEPRACDGSLAFLDAGKDGVIRGILWQRQQKVVSDAVSCRFYLPMGWDEKPEEKMVSPHNCVASVAGPRDHEWLSVEHLHLSPEHVHDDLGGWVNMPRILCGKLLLCPHHSKAKGVGAYTEVSFSRISRRDVLYMKFHNADDMATFVGLIEIEGRLYRILIVIVRRGADCWKFEYVFPAADGVTRESQEFHSEEILSAARIFVPIETFGKICCAVCGEKMDDTKDGPDEEKPQVWMKGLFLFGNMQVPKAALGISCCATCCGKIRVYGIAKAKLEEIPAVREQVAKGASIIEVKCGTDTISYY